MPDSSDRAQPVAPGAARPRTASAPPRPARRARVGRAGWILAVWIVVTAVVIPFDGRLAKWVAHAFEVAELRGPFLDALTYLMTRSIFIIIAAVLLLHPRRGKLLIGFGSAAVMCAAMVHILKFVFGRARPELGFGPYHFTWFGDPRLSFDSFPSGHAASCMLAIALLAMYLPAAAWLVTPAAILVGLERVAVQRHFLSDVIAGAGIALLAVHLSVHLFGPGCFGRLDLRRTFRLPSRSERNASPSRQRECAESAEGSMSVSVSQRPFE